MTIRKILAPVSGSPRDAEALHTAFRLARDLPAHVTVMFARMSPSESVPMVGEGVSSTVVEQLMTTAEQEWTRRASVARRHFDECREKHGLPQRSAPSDPPIASVDWLEESGREDGVVRRLSVVNDLIVLPNQTGSDDDLQFTLTFEGTLMAGCRPILLAPKIAGDTVGFEIDGVPGGLHHPAREDGRDETHGVSKEGRSNDRTVNEGYRSGYPPSGLPPGCR